MSEYKGIVGQKVVSYTTDPDNPVQGQVWYNATTNTLKLEGQTTSGSWSTGGNLNTARKDMGGVGIQTAALAYGGSTPSSTRDETESYNGTSWTEVADLATAVYFNSGAGTSSLGLSFASDPGSGATTQTEEWTFVHAIKTVTTS